MARSKSYKDYLIESLREPTEAVGYLNAALHDDDPEVFLMALRDVTEALGGVGTLSKKTKLNRESLYRMLSKNGNPSLSSLHTLLDSLGFRLSVEKSSHPPKSVRGRRKPGIPSTSP